MRRVRLVEKGWQRELSYEPEAADPPAPTGPLVLIQLEASGVCHRDLIDRAGRFAFMQFPITPGHEGVGRIVAVGDAVTRWKVGDRVATMHRDSCGQCEACQRNEPSLCASAAFVLGILADGTYASHLLAPESALFAVPDHLPAAQAAVYHCTFGTAWRGIGRVAPGQRVLVTGANGGVGVAAVQLAARMGAEVIAQVRHERHVDDVGQLGAKEVVVDDGATLHKKVRGIDVAVDCVGQPTFNGALRTLRLGGRIVAIGNVVDERVALNLGYIIVNALHVVGSSGASPADMAGLLDFAETHSLSLPIADELPLSAAEEAQRRVRAGGLWGRVVMLPD
jgi:D-arabinose 1-dehydrogenase-like Zn-dependent alcohol dehydrogenase